MFDSDQEVLDAIRSGTQRDAALASVYKKSALLIRNLGRKYGCTEDDCDDALQDSIVVLWQNVVSGKFSLLSKLTSYIYAICENKFKRLHRDRAKLPLVDVEDADAIPEEVANDEMVVARERQLMKYLEELGEGCRNILVDFYTYGLNMKELCKKYDYKNVETVTSQKYKCFMQLKKKFTAA